jgi:type II secretion system protein C
MPPFAVRWKRVMKLKALLEKMRAWVARLRVPRVPSGIASIPGAKTTLAGGKFRLPVIDWEKVVRKSFLYNSIAAVICGYFAADLLVASLTPWFPPSEAPRPRVLNPGERHDIMSYFNVVIPRGRPNLFNEKGLVPDNDEGGGVDPNGPPVRTSLPLTLVGVIVLQDVKKSVASIEDKGANQVVAVRVGDPIVRDTQVLEISDDRVLFLNQSTNRREFIELPHDEKVLSVKHAAPVNDGGIQNLGGNHLKIQSDALKNALGPQFGQILTQALCSPEMQGGKPIGYKCTQIEKGSVYERLGLQDGDVVTALDGQSLTNMAPLMQKLNDLREGRVQHLSITIQRNGAPTTTYFDLD